MTWLRTWWRGLVWDWRGWRAGECSWWQALWGHRATPWWRVPGFMPKGRR